VRGEKVLFWRQFLLREKFTDTPGRLGVFLFMIILVFLLLIQYVIMLFVLLSICLQSACYLPQNARNIAHRSISLK
jgi:hypothetical protein